MRQFWIRGTHSGNQRLDHLTLDPVRKVPRVGDVLEAAPAIGDLLILGQRISDEGKRSQTFLEGFGQRPGRCLAFLAVHVLQQIERGFDSQRFSSDLETQASDSFVEKPVPGRVCGH